MIFVLDKSKLLCYTLKRNGKLAQKRNKKQFFSFCAKFVCFCKFKIGDIQWTIKT